VVRDWIIPCHFESYVPVSVSLAKTLLMPAAQSRDPPRQPELHRLAHFAPHNGIELRNVQVDDLAGGDETGAQPVADLRYQLTPIPVSGRSSQVPIAPPALVAPPVSQLVYNLPNVRQDVKSPCVVPSNKRPNSSETN
jgi:hypothetical protein